MTYRDLDQASAAIAVALRRTGVGGGDYVGVLAGRSWRSVVASLGVVRAGASYVPLEPTLPAPRLALMVATVAAKAVLASPGLTLPLSGDGDARLMAIDDAIADGSGQPFIDHPASTSPGRPVLVCFTSGSTGLPKAVPLSQGGILSLCTEATERPRRGEPTLHMNRLSFDASAWEVWAALLNGAQLVVHGAPRPDPAALARVITEQHVRAAVFPTGFFHQMAETQMEAMRSLRLLIVGGDVMSPAYARAFVNAVPDCVLINGYGPTEACVLATAYQVKPPVDDVVPIGTPWPGRTVTLMGPDLVPVEPGEPGEVVIGGSAVSSGYIDNTEETAQRFLDDPLGGHGSRLFRTGDLARLRPDGLLEFLGRSDSQVKIRGYRVEPGEVEAMLAAHPDVTHVVVATRESLQGHRQLIAYVTTNAGTQASALRLWLSERLPDYLIPSTIRVLDSFPLTPVGKIDRRALPEVNVASGRHLTTEVELSVAHAWRSVLKVDEVFSDDNFFEAGGDSLLALGLIGELHKMTGVEVPLRAVFESPTVAGLARRVGELAAIASTGEIPAIQPTKAPNEDVPASRGQEQACFFDALALDALPYQSQSLLWLDGALDVAALTQALTALVARHEILRTTFHLVGGRHVQRVHPAFPVELQTVDVSSAPDPRRAAQEAARSACQFRMNVESLPLVRWTLIRLGENSHALVQLEHHVVHDGWSFVRLLDDMIQGYRSAIEGTQRALPLPPVNYRDFVRWQEALTSGPTGQAQIKYWLTRLSDLPNPVELPTDHLRPPSPTFRGGQIRLPVPAALVDSVNEQARVNGCTPFMLMLTAFILLLHRLSGSRDLVVGSGLANRRARKSEELVGMLVNTVALRARVAEGATAYEVLQLVQDACLDAYEAQEVPFEEVVRALAPERRTDMSPVYRHLFSFHDTPLPSLALPGLNLTLEEGLSNRSAKSDINVVVVNRRGQDSGQGHMQVLWEFSEDLFDAETARRMSVEYLELLSHMVNNLSAPASRLRLASSSELEALLGLSTGPRNPYERDSSIGDVFQTRVAEGPDAIAVASEGRVLTYAEVDEQSRRLAHQLLKLGLERGELVGVLDERRPETVVALLAVLYAGGAYLGIDPSLPVDRLTRQLTEASVRLVCRAAKSDERGEVPLVLQGDSSSPKIVLVDADREQVREEGSSQHDLPTLGRMDRAYVCFTSGSTGTPKGVVIPHQAVLRLVRNPNYVGLGPSERILGMAPLSFDASTFEIWGALLNGATLYLAPPGPLSMTEIADVVQSGEISTAWLTAPLFHGLVDHAPQALHGLRQLLAGGDVLSPDHVNRALQLLPQGGTLVNGYGPTETTTFACCHAMSAGTRVEGRVPLGRPISNTDVFVLDWSGELAPPGAVGEIWIGGDGIALGYLGRPDLTAERFRPAPPVAGENRLLYRTGDLGRWAQDGTLEFLGRVDRQVKIRGFRVEPDEVEHVLRGHSFVDSAFVIPVEFGRDDRRLVAYATPALTADVGDSRADVDLWLKERLPTHALPAEIVWLEQLPLNSSGKVDVARLPRPASRWSNDAGVFTGDVPAGTAADHSPTRLESRLLGIWEDVLQVRPVGLHDDFFDLGGHSLLAVSLLAEVEKVTGGRLALAALFEAPTVSGMAALLREGGWDASWGCLVPLTTTGGRRPMFFVTAGDGNATGYGPLARRLGPDQPFYALQPSGQDGRTRLRATVPAMARDYVAAIRDVQPEGPYVLGGRCFGALIAYEMGRQLEAAGQQVEVVFCLDSIGPLWAPRVIADGTNYDELMNLALFLDSDGRPDTERLFSSPAEARRFVTWLREPVTEHAGFTVNRYLHTAWTVRKDLQAAYDLDNGGHAGLLTWAWRSGPAEIGLNTELVAAPPDPGVARPSHRHLGHTVGLLVERALDYVDVATRGRVYKLERRRPQRLLDLARQAAAGYRAPPLKAPVHLLKTEAFRREASHARWYGLDSGGVVESYVEGSHLSMMREPDVATVATAIRTVAQAVQSP